MLFFFFCFKQKTAYEMRISDWSSDVCSSDLIGVSFRRAFLQAGLKLAQCLIWRKDLMVMGRSDYQWIHEPILYGRSEEHTSELQSLMRISYAVFCLKKKKNNNKQ